MAWLWTHMWLIAAAMFGIGFWLNRWLNADVRRERDRLAERANGWTDERVALQADARRLDDIEGEYTRLRDENVRLTAALAELEGIRPAHADAVGELRALRAEQLRWETERTSLLARAEEGDLARRDRTNLSNDFSRLVTKVDEADALRREHAGWAAERPRLLAAWDELGELRRRSREGDDETAALKAQIVSLEAARTELQAQIPGLRDAAQRLDELQTERANWQHERTSMHSDLMRLEAVSDENAHLRNEINELTAKARAFDALEGERADWRNERARAERERESWAAERDGMMNQLRQIDMLRADLRTAQGRNDELTLKLAELEGLRAEHAQWTSERASMHSRLEELEALRAALARWRAERSGLLVRVRELEERLASATATGTVSSTDYLADLGGDVNVFTSSDKGIFETELRRADRARQTTRRFNYDDAPPFDRDPSE